MNNQTTLHQQLNEDVFRILIKESPTPVALYTGEEMEIRIANKAIIDIWGKGDNVIGRTYFNLLPELEDQGFHAILLNVYKSGIAYEGKEQKVDLLVDGKHEEFYFNFTFKPLRNDNDEVWGVLNTAADVTELVTTRQKLAESEQRVQFALQAAELGTWDLNPKLQTVIWDDRCKELCGFQKNDEIKYADLLKFVHPEDEQRLRTAVMQAYNPATGGNYDIIIRTVDNSGHLKYWIHLKGKAYFNDKNEAIRFAGTVQDITREILDKQEQQKLLALIDNTADMVAVGSMDGSVTYINKTTYALLGIESTKEALKPGVEYFANNEADKVSSEIEPAVQQHGKWEGEMHYQHFKTGESIPVYINCFRIDDPLNGQPIGMASVARDLRPEKAARNEQYKLLSLINHSSDFVSLSDLDGNVTYVNTAGRKMLGITGINEHRRHNSEFIMPGELAKLKDHVNNTLMKHGKWSGEILYRHFKTGETIPVYGTTMLVYDAVTGLPQGRASIARDLRREIADKKALTDSEQLLKNITNASPTALWMADAEGNITYVNQTWIDWTGIEYEKHMGFGWTTAIIEEDKSRAVEKFMADLNARRFYEVDFRITRKDGEIRWCIATGNPQYNSGGEFTGYIGACTDVTDKTLAEREVQLRNRELNEQIRQFEFVTDFMPVQLWTARPDGELDYINQRAVDYFGVAAQEISGPSWLNNVHPDDTAGCIEAWNNAVNTGNIYQCEFRLKDKDQNYKWHLSRALPFIIDGKIIKWFGTNTDIDEQKQLQRQKDDFLGIASHELKTPVTSIKAYAQVLGAMLTKEGEHKKAEMVLRMDAQINRLTNLIGDLLDVTKINSGRLQFNKTWFDFNEALQETIEDLQHTTQKHKLIQNFSPTGKIYSDKDRISQVVTNFITNAIKYSPHTDTIIITAQRENNEVIVCVQDFGVGIPEDKKDRVFEQFYRVSGNKQHTFPGLGLGLYISSEIIKREGGRMWVNSVESKGSTFCFALPVDDTHS
ncbi:PAS domain S-box-containing protein [Mucilaginibacter gossypiicola]|uniref:histidine kinase n=1 Tax=Mucilaginibacter gossypiicola TaxID=551995 RepID=A0A1H7ZNP2_9SPHI|nr:PAS domain-containing sensor histidine kinase [Mucilaginibacter gossypiicola]SEM59109.1 PAS domain S-box-containing protein [Mucilaginibacter gossypiicola]